MDYNLNTISILFGSGAPASGTIEFANNVRIVGVRTTRVSSSQLEYLGVEIVPNSQLIPNVEAAFPLGSNAYNPDIVPVNHREFTPCNRIGRSFDITLYIQNAGAGAQWSASSPSNNTKIDFLIEVIADY